MTIHLLRRVPLLTKPRRARSLEEICKPARVRECEPGETIFCKGDPADEMFIVLYGRVKLFSTSHGVKRKTFACVEPGEPFGDADILAGGLRSSWASSFGHCRLLVMSEAVVKKLLLKEPRLACFLLARASQRLRRAYADIEGLVFGKMINRVAQALYELAQRGTKFRSGVLLGERYTQQELADLVGTTRVPLARVIAALRRAQLLELHHGRYFIKDSVKLAAFGRAGLFERRP